ncbi:uncharacterized protein V6R79_016894 [Siganus canaliculatus]
MTRATPCFSKHDSSLTSTERSDHDASNNPTNDRRQEESDPEQQQQLLLSCRSLHIVLRWLSRCFTEQPAVQQSRRRQKRHNEGERETPRERKNEGQRADVHPYRNASLHKISQGLKVGVNKRSPLSFIEHFSAESQEKFLHGYYTVSLFTPQLFRSTESVFLLTPCDYSLNNIYAVGTSSKSSLKGKHRGKEQ